MAPRTTRTTAAVPSTPAASKARGRSKKRDSDKAIDCASNAASPVSVPAVPVVELMSDDDSGHLVLPIRFQCPLCFDVLRRPIQLPCCQRHLCEECLKRGLEITSSNCGFCRKRIVGMARKKQYKVDDGLWNEIRRCCPFVAHTDGNADCVVDVDFVDENAPSKQRMVDAENEAVAMREAELTLSQKSDSHGDGGRRPTLTIAVDVSPQVTVMRTRSALETIDTNVAGKHKQQRRLESFFGLGDAPSSQSSRPSSAGSTRSLRSTTSSSSNSSSSSGRGRVGKRPVVAVGKKPMMETARSKPLLRSSSHSPKRRKPQAVQRTLLQLTIHSPVGRATRQSSSASVASTASSKGDRPRSAGSMTTRTRRPWRCSHCTYENTCFDTRCSMCQRYPAHAPVLP